MAEQKGSEQKSLEMRVAELEDKLSKMHITEDEMKAYHKVASLLGGGQAAAGTAASPQICVISRCVINPICIVRCIIRPICECFECGGGCLPGAGGVGSAGGFGSLGM
jgi:hypothetical protein